MITISYNYHPNNVIISAVASLSSDIALIFEDNISKLLLLFAYMEQVNKEKNAVTQLFFNQISLNDFLLQL